jgi:hypothetical protein
LFLSVLGCVLGRWMQCYTVRSMVGWCSSECGVRNQRSGRPAVAMVEDDRMYAVVVVEADQGARARRHGSRADNGVSRGCRRGEERTAR